MAKKSKFKKHVQFVDPIGVSPQDENGELYRILDGNITHGEMKSLSARGKKYLPKNYDQLKLYDTSYAETLQKTKEMAENLSEQMNIAIAPIFKGITTLSEPLQKLRESIMGVGIPSYIRDVRNLGEIMGSHHAFLQREQTPIIMSPPPSRYDDMRHLANMASEKTAQKIQEKMQEDQRESHNVLHLGEEVYFYIGNDGKVSHMNLCGFIFSSKQISKENIEKIREYYEDYAKENRASPYKLKPSVIIGVLYRILKNGKQISQYEYEFDREDIYDNWEIIIDDIKHLLPRPSYQKPQKPENMSKKSAEIGHLFLVMHTYKSTYYKVYNITKQNNGSHIIRG